MPQVTGLKPQKNQKRVNVYLDGKFGFGIDLDNLVKLRLKIEQELTEEEVAEIVKKAEFQKTLDKLLKFATLRPRSQREIEGWFKRKKVHESLSKGLFDRLNRLELVDDIKFSRWWVEQRQNFKPKSKRVLKQELMNKGIKKEIIGEVLEETPIDEEKIARDLLSKRAHRWAKFNPREAQQKKIQYLSQKGFGWEIIEKIIKTEE